jgi:hypothetical protein
MPLVIIKKKIIKLCNDSVIYDISHKVTGSLVFAPGTDIFINDDVYQGPGVYRLFTGYSSVTGVGNLNIVGQSVCSAPVVSGNYIVTILN